MNVNTGEVKQEKDLTDAERESGAYVPVEAEAAEGGNSRKARRARLKAQQLSMLAVAASGLAQAAPRVRRAPMKSSLPDKEWKRRQKARKAAKASRRKNRA